MELDTRRYPIGIQHFEQLRNRGCVYVDKTELIYRLTHTDQIYFLSRPRRFGKSLLLSTLEAYFQGKKELFKGLAMEHLEQDGLTATDEQFDAPTDQIIGPIPVLYQSGYLTIKGYDPTFRAYNLAYPNSEVRYGFTESLLPMYVHRFPQEDTLLFPNPKPELSKHI